VIYNWQTQMNTDPDRIECTLQNDSRLAAGAGAIVSHMAERANLARDVRENLAAIVAETCKAIFQHFGRGGSSDSAISLGVGNWPDHIEVIIEFPGEDSKENWLPRKMGGAPGNGTAPSGVDRVKFETVDGHSRLTLIKYSPPAGSAPKS